MVVHAAVVAFVRVVAVLEVRSTSMGSEFGLFSISDAGNFSDADCSSFTKILVVFVIVGSSLVVDIRSEDDSSGIIIAECFGP